MLATPRIVLALAALSLVLAFAATASAKGHGRHGAKEACKADVEQFCASVEPGEGRIIECLKGVPNLSQSCSEQMAKMEQRFEALRQSCEGDAQSLCPGKEGPALHACMREHKDQLSDGCRAAVKKARKGPGGHAGPGGHGMKALHEACGDDTQRLCPGVEREDLRTCMESHRAELSEQCTAMVEKVEEGRNLIMAACGDDAARLCPDTEGPERMGCMREHKDEVSEQCRAAVQAARPGKRGKDGAHGKRRRRAQ